MHNTLVLVTLSILVFVTGVASAQQEAITILNPIEPDQTEIDVSGHVDPDQIEVAHELIEILNSVRGNLGLQGLEFNPLLTKAAQVHVDDMAANHYFSHASLDNRNAGHRIRRQGYFYDDYAENLVQRWDISPLGAFNQLWASPNHQPTMVDPDYDEVGIAFAKSTTGEVYYALILGKR